MNKMKKILLVTVMFVTAFMITGCGNKNVEGSLEDIMAKLYKGISEDELPMMLGNIPVDKENAEMYLGTSEIEFEEALASESGIGSFAHSIVLLRTKEGADVNKVVNDVKENCDPRKWICVEVPKEDVVVKSKGNLVVLIMVNENRDKIVKNFDNL